MNNNGADSSSTIKSGLSFGREHQTIRIVNASGRNVSFSVGLHASSTPTNLMINPRQGVMRPSSYTLVKIRNLDYTKKVKDPILLDLRYNLQGARRHEPTQIAGRVKLKMSHDDSCGYAGADGGTKSTVDLLSVILRTLRATVLFALITYNIILIKYQPH